MLVSSTDCHPEEPPSVNAEPARFVLVALDESMTLPVKSDLPKKSVGTYDFTGTPFSDLALVLRVKNVSNNEETFSFIDTWDVHVEAEDGHELQLIVARDATRPPLQTDFLRAKPSTVNFLIECRLSYGSGNRLVLWGCDYLGGIWGYSQITPGKYRIYIDYGFEPPRGNMLWHEIAKENLA